MTSIRPAGSIPSTSKQIGLHPRGATQSARARHRASTLPGEHKSRYSVEKLLDYDVYARTTPRWRLILVVIGTPLLPLLAVLVPPLLPLRDPALGILENKGFCVHFVIVMTLTVLGAILQGRSVTSLAHHEYTTRQAVLVSLLSSGLLLGVTIGVAQLWRFPIPFTWAIGFAPWVVCVVWANILVFRRQLFSGALKKPALAFLPSFVIQISQIILYPAFSAAFGFVNEYQQVMLTLLFPLIKFLMKKVLRIASRSLGEYSEEVAVSGVEICAAMYQSQIMQNTPSFIAIAAIMGLDLFQGIVSVKVFMDKKNHVVGRRELVSTAIQLLWSKQTTAKSFVGESVPDSASRAPTAIQVISSQESQPTIHDDSPPHSVSSTPERGQPSMQQIMSLLPPNDIKLSDDSNGAHTKANIVDHALEIMHSAESILLVEYFEVAIPVVNGVFLAVAGQMDSARYNPNLRPFYNHPERLRAAMANLVLYSLLQGLSLVAMNLVMWYRYRISGLTHLAYVLERHRWSLQSKMVSWLAVFFNFTVMHYGTDFKFKFDFSMSDGESE